MAFLSVVSCSEKMGEVIPQPSVPDVGKIINTRASGEECREILVKFNQTPDAAAVEAACVDGVESMEKVFTSMSGKEELEKRFGMDRWYSVKMTDGSDPEIVAQRFAGIASVSAVEYGVTYKKASDCISHPYVPDNGIQTRAESSAKIFNDPSLPAQWHYINNGDVSVATSVYKGADINVADVWRTLTTGDNSIIVAVVDEGVKYTHPDLKNNVWTNPKEISNGSDSDGNGYVDDIHGYNFVSNGPITWAKTEDSGHGTHCAGTISAVNNNGIGVSGVAGGSGKGDGVKIMSCQIFDNDRGGSSSIVAKAIKYAADMGASIISCSFGYAGGKFKSDLAYKNGNGGNNSLEYDAIHYFEATKNNDVLDGGIAIFASGNDGDPYATYPGALNDVISVSAFGPDYLPAYYTNYGPGCNITASGGEAYLAPWTSFKPMVLSTLPSELGNGDYGYMQGTSMACPHVSGVVALGLAYSKKLGKHYSAKEFKEMVLSSANDFETKLASAGKKNYAPAGEGYRVPLANYRKQMGTGSIDAWRLMMKIEGTPCLTAEAGEEQWLDLSGAFGTASVNLTYQKVEYSKADAEAIGMTKEPYIKYGRLFIHPTRCGAAKFKITAVGGGEAVGGDDAIGGMEMSQTVSVVVRPFKSENGGWL